MKYTLAIAALLATTSALKITQLNSNNHACDFIEDNGEEKSTSLMPEYVQIESKIRDEDDSVEGARAKFAAMNAAMEQSVAQADAKRAEQQASYEQNIKNDDPQAQLQGLMNAQQSLKRISGAFAAKPKEDKVKDMAQKLGIPMTPELMQLGSNEAISNALVEIAVGMGKSEEEISAALGAE